MSTLPDDRKGHLDAAFLALTRTDAAESFEEQAKDDYLFQLRLCANEVQLAAGDIDEKLRAAAAGVLSSARAESEENLRAGVHGLRGKLGEVEEELRRERVRTDGTSAELGGRLEAFSAEIRATCDDISKRLGDIDDRGRRQEQAREGSQSVANRVSSSGGGGGSGGVAGGGYDVGCHLVALADADKKHEEQLSVVCERMATAHEDRSRMQETTRSQDIRLADMQTTIFKLLNKVDEYHKTLVDVKERVKSVECQASSAQTTITDRVCRLDDASGKAVLTLEGAVHELNQALKQVQQEQCQVEKGLVMANTRISDDISSNKELILRMEGHYVKSTDAIQAKVSTLEQRITGMEVAHEKSIEQLRRQYEEDLQGVRMESIGKLAQMIEGVKALMNEDHGKFMDFRREIDQRFARLEEAADRKQLVAVAGKQDGGGPPLHKAGADVIGEQRISRVQAGLEKKLKELEERTRTQAMDEGRRIHEFRRTSNTCSYEVRELRREIGKLNTDIRAIHVSLATGRHVPSRPAPEHHHHHLPGATVNGEAGPSLNGAVPTHNETGSPRGRPAQRSAYDLHGIDAEYKQAEPGRGVIGNGSPATDVCCGGPYYTRGGVGVEECTHEGNIDKAEADQFSHCEYLRRQIQVPEVGGSAEDAAAVTTAANQS